MASAELRVSVRVAWWTRALPLVARVAGVVAPVLPDWVCRLVVRAIFAGVRRGVRVEA